MTKQLCFFYCFYRPCTRISVSSQFVFIQQIHRCLHELSSSAAMKKKNFMIIIETHQFFYKSSCFVHDRFKQSGAMTDLKYGKTSIVKIYYRLAGLVKNFFW